MKIVHRFSLRADEGRCKLLSDLGVVLSDGIVFPGGRIPLFNFDIDESHPRWMEVSKVLADWGADDVVRTEFSESDVACASWLDVSAWHYGFPQPRDDEFGYLEATYDLHDWCEACGVGKSQKAPFQMKTEPKWGRHSILQMTWVYDELFVTPEVWKRAFEPSGIGFREVTNRKGDTLQTVVQIAVDGTVKLDMHGVAGVRCDRCGRVKFEYERRGGCPGFLDSPSNPSVVRSEEWYGSGAAASRRFLISQTVLHRLTRADRKGLTLVPSRA